MQHHTKHYFFAGLFIALTVSFTVCTNTGYAQLPATKTDTKAKPTVVKLQKQTLFAVLKQLNKQKGVYFLIGDSSIATKEVELPDLNAEIEIVLTQLLKNSGLKFKKVSNNTYVIAAEKPKSKGEQTILYSIPESVSKQQQFSGYINKPTGPLKRVTGKVTNVKDGFPLDGVSVVVRGAKQGTVTGVDGSFSITVPDNAVLEFSFVGFVTTNEKAPLNGKLEIKMQEASGDLSDVVIVAYGTQKRATFTGAATTVDQVMLEDVPRASFQESLQGNVEGLVASNGSGQPGSAPNIRIRGVGSVGASSAPLYVIDGVPVVSGDISGFNSNTIAGINPLDIQSTVVLKDATAAALYGSRGGNGVILITTRKGVKSKKAQMDCRIQTGTNFYTLNNSRDRTLSSVQMLQYLREAWKNAGREPLLFEEQIVKEGIDSTVNTNWFKQVFRIGHYSSVALNASGGNDKTTFYISGSLYKQEGIQRGIDYRKITTLMNLSHKFSDKLTLTMGFSGAYQLSNSSVVGGVLENPTRAVYRLQSWLPIYNTDGTYRTDYNNGYNPVAVINSNIRRSTTYVMRGTANAVYKIAKGFTYETTAGLDLSSAYRLQYSDPKYGNFNIAQNGSISNYSQIISNWIFTNILRYSKKINRFSNIEAFAGYEASRRSDIDLGASVSNLSVANLYTLSNGANPALPSSDPSNSALVSQFFNTNYSLKNRYYISASIRNDESSRFGKIKPNGIFWSLGAGWDVLREKWFHVWWLNNLKLRASYGALGNSIGLSDFGSRGLYTINNAYAGQPGMLYSQLRNDSLTWEKHYPLNIGLDVTFLRGRINVSADWYTRKSTDLILDYQIPSNNGIVSASGNYGSMRNTGLEVGVSTLNINPTKKNEFKWTSRIVFSYNKNKILKLVRTTYPGDYIRREGGTFYEWYLPTYAGVDAQTGAALWLKDDSAKSITNQYSIGYSVPQGTALPLFDGSITNTFSYKGFTLLIQLYCKWGGKIYDQSGVFTSSDGSDGFGSTGNVNIYNYLNRWRQPGDITDVPAPVFGGRQTGISTMNSTRFLYDGSYIRLRDINLSYTFNTKLLRKAKITSCRAYVRANNLLTYVKDKRLPYDPEAGADGTINQRPPQARTVLLGVNFEF